MEKPRGHEGSIERLLHQNPWHSSLHHHPPDVAMSPRSWQQRPVASGGLSPCTKKSSFLMHRQRQKNLTRMKIKQVNAHVSIMLCRKLFTMPSSSSTSVVKGADDRSVLFNACLLSCCAQILIALHKRLALICAPPVAPAMPYKSSHCVTREV